MPQEIADGNYEGYRVTVRPCAGEVRAILNGEMVACSHHALIMSETRLPDVFYFPYEDVRHEYLTPTDLVTHCPFKGNAAHWSLKVQDAEKNNGVWSYEDAFEEALTIKGYLACG